MNDNRCAWCNRPTYGHYVTADGRRYCHDLASPTCYEKAKAAGVFVNLFDGDGAA